METNTHSIEAFDPSLFDRSRWLTTSDIAALERVGAPINYTFRVIIDLSALNSELTGQAQLNSRIDELRTSFGPSRTYLGPIQYRSFNDQPPARSEIYVKPDVHILAGVWVIGQITDEELTDLNLPATVRIDPFGHATEWTSRSYD